MVIFLCTDMEGLAGLSTRTQCVPEDPSDPGYLYGRRLLTDETNVAVAACFDAGATEVRVLDGHGYHSGCNLILDDLDPRARLCRIEPQQPMRIDGLDETVDGLMFIGQHAMAGTLNGFLDHTGSSKVLCRFLVNGVEHGEPGYMALYAGVYGIPVVYASGDEALCAEMARMFPHAQSTPTKKGTGWATCELYPLEEVRAAIRNEIGTALGKGIDKSKAYRLPGPLEITMEFAWSELADKLAPFPGVSRPHARSVAWKISSPLDIYARPCAQWHPLT